MCPVPTRYCSMPGSEIKAASPRTEACSSRPHLRPLGQRTHSNAGSLQRPPSPVVRTPVRVSLVSGSPHFAAPAFAGFRAPTSIIGCSAPCPRPRSRLHRFISRPPVRQFLLLRVLVQRRLVLLFTAPPPRKQSSKHATATIRTVFKHSHSSLHSPTHSFDPTPRMGPSSSQCLPRRPPSPSVNRVPFARPPSPWLGEGGLADGARHNALHAPWADGGAAAVESATCTPQSCHHTCHQSCHQSCPSGRTPIVTGLAARFSPSISSFSLSWSVRTNSHFSSSWSTWTNSSKIAFWSTWTKTTKTVPWSARTETAEAGGLSLVR